MKIESGKSTENSITFCSGNMETTATYDKDGKIKITNTYNERENVGLEILKPIFFIAGIGEAINLGIYLYGFSKLVNLIPIVIFLVYEASVIILNIKNGEIIKNHTVEHQIIYAVSKYGRTVTHKDIVKAKKLTKRCGTSFFPIYIAYMIAALIISLKFNIIVPQIIVYALFTITYKTFPIYYIGYIGQSLQLAKPDEKSYKLGEAALAAYIDYLEKIENLKFADDVEYYISKDENELEDYKVNTEDSSFKEVLEKTTQIYEKEILKEMEKKFIDESNKEK